MCPLTSIHGRTGSRMVLGLEFLLRLTGILSFVVMMENSMAPNVNQMFKALSISSRIDRTGENS